MQCTRALRRATDRRSPDRSNRMPLRKTIATLAIRLQVSETRCISLVCVVILVAVCAGNSICQWYSQNSFRGLTPQKLSSSPATATACSTSSQSRLKLVYQAQQLAQNPSYPYSRSHGHLSLPVVQQRSRYQDGCVAHPPSPSGSPRVAS